MKLFTLAVAAAFVVSAGSAQAAIVGVEAAVFGSSFEPLLPAAPEDKDALPEMVTDAGRTIGLTSGQTSPLPEPSTWAMLIMGFGAAGAAMRRRHSDMTYRLEECAPHGGVMTEEFAAPDDSAALNRAASVVDGDFKLWRGDVLVRG